MMSRSSRALVSRNPWSQTEALDPVSQNPKTRIASLAMKFLFLPSLAMMFLSLPSLTKQLLSVPSLAMKFLYLTSLVMMFLSLPSMTMMSLSLSSLAIIFYPLVSQSVKMRSMCHHHHTKRNLKRSWKKRQQSLFLLSLLTLSRHSNTASRLKRWRARIGSKETRHQ